MSASSKFDLSSDDPDKQLYTFGHCGSHVAPSLDRSGSFHENMGNPLLSNLPNITRSSLSVTQGDVLNFFQCVRFDPKSIVVAHKLNRPAEFKRLARAAVGVSLEDSLPPSSKSKQLFSPSLEDHRRLKSVARQCCTKARERMKIFSDCLSVINNCFPTIPSRKRSRLDDLSNDRSTTLLPIDRSSSAMDIGKMGSQNHVSLSGLELGQQKSGEMIENAIPNKRTRTSMVDTRMDVRAKTPARTSETMNKDGDVVRLSSCSAVHREDQTLSNPADGLEKSKLKKKRTGMRPDIAATSMETKPVDGYREPKRGKHPQLPAEARSRSGIANGSMGLGKVVATFHTSSGMCSSISRIESDSSCLVHERREWPRGQEKKRVNLKAVNNSNSQEDLSSGNPTSGSKLNAIVRAPQSGSVDGVSKLYQGVQRYTPTNDWELSNGASRLPGVLGADDRKRTPCTLSSSHPVASGVQKLQKVSRISRTNLLPLVPGNSETPFVNTTLDMIVNGRPLPAHSPQQAQMKSDNFSPAAPSDGEESGTAETKYRDKNKKCDGIDEKSGQNIQRMSILLQPPNKNKVVSRDDHGDGVRRKGRTGRGFTLRRSLLPLTVEKVASAGTTKQIGSSRLGLDKTERAGQKPASKLSDRKAYTRQKHIAINMAADFLVSSDDGHEELLAAANAVTNTAQAPSSPFWKKMESLFCFISAADISYLKDQVKLGLGTDTHKLAPAPLGTESSNLFPTCCRFNESRREENKTTSVEVDPEHLALRAKMPCEISLHQRLIAALIPEEGNYELFCSVKEGLESDTYGSRFDVEKDMDSHASCSRVTQNCDLSGYSKYNGSYVNTNGKSFYELDHYMRENNIVSFPDMEVIPRYDHLQNDSLSDQLMPVAACSEYQYINMSMNERLLMEVHSIGLYPDLVSNFVQSQDGEVSRDVTRLDEKYQEQVSRKKNLLSKLLTAASEAKGLQEKDFEQRALDKLVEMAFVKYKSCWCPSAHGMKSAGGKMAKLSALAFVKRALERYQEFEVTGKSCFDEPLYRDMFISGVSRLIDGELLNSNTDKDSSKLHLSTSGCSMEVRTSAPVCPQQSPLSNNQEMHSSELLLSANLVPEQNTGKEDTCWSNRVQKRDLLLDDVCGTIGTSPGISSVLGGSLSCSTKGKRSGRDREGKGSGREVLPKTAMAKIGRSLSAIAKGKRKSKAKPKQKTVHLSASVNGFLGKISEQPKVMFSSALTSRGIIKNDIAKVKYDYNQDILEEPIDLSRLQLPEMDYLSIANDLDAQGEDIGSWLNSMEEDGLQDLNYGDGLGIPMDNLGDLKIVV